MDVIEYINKFITSKEIVTFFEANNLKPILKNNTLIFQNTNNSKLQEKVSVNLDSETNRLYIIGSSLACILTEDSTGKIYIKDLIFGNIKERTAQFVMHHNHDYEEFIDLKFIDNKNTAHNFKIKNDSLNIERINIFFSYFTLKESHLTTIEKRISYFQFTKTNNTIDILETTTEENINSLEEFKLLENTYPTITSYLQLQIPFIGECISESIKERNNTNNKKDNIENKDDIIKEYEIKRGKGLSYDELSNIVANARRKELKIAK